MRFYKILPLIKMMSELNEIFDCVDTPKEGISNKREYLKNHIKQGQALSGKTPWTEERLDKASDKVIDKLYNSVKTLSVKQKDVMSRLSGVDNVNEMMKDINGNFLIKNSASEMMGKLTPNININSHTPMEILGSHVYEKYSVYMAPISLFCTVFNHLDWEAFAKISEERQATDESTNDMPEEINE